MNDVKNELKNELKLKIVKRNGESVEYDRGKIERAIGLAMGETDESLEWGRYEDMLAYIEGKIEDGVSVEDVSDVVEDSMMEFGLRQSAKRYILYRAEHDKIRKSKWEMSDLQRDILTQKYMENETFEEWLERVSGGNQDVKKLIRQKKFLYGGRILANRGLNRKGRKITLSNCYVLEPPKDNLESIFETAGRLARTFSYGGGVGIDIGKLRPRGSVVNNSAKETTGAVSFMDLYSLTTGLIGQNNRRGALMISIPVNHPDIEEFIDIKNDLNKVTKANISIRITNEFMKAVESKSEFELSFIVEDTGEKICKIVNAYDMFYKFAKSNWRMAEPGILMWDTISEYHLMSEDPTFEYAGTNPCAEEPLPSGGSCLLGSINLAEFVKKPFTSEAYFDMEDFKKAVRISTIGLNEVLDEGLPLHPLEEQKKSVRELRQIGLGVMGIADMLIKLGIRYGSQESLDISDEIADAMVNSALQQSALLAKEFGTFQKYNKDYILSSPFFIKNANKDTVELVEKYGLRNSQVLTIAPTGSISTMLGVSGGIEPHFMISYTRKTETLNDGEDTYYKVFTPIAQVYMDMKNITKEEYLPKDLFVTSQELPYLDRIKMQSVWQKHIDASISSTVNLPKETTVEQVIDLYTQAWKHGLKGITIFRDGCERAGILGNHGDGKKVDATNMNAEQLKELLDKKVLEELSSNPNQCPICHGEMINTGGCSECLDCGYSPCAV